MQSLTFQTRSPFTEWGQRVSLTPEGLAIPAPAGNCGIGTNLGNGAGASSPAASLPVASLQTPPATRAQHPTTIMKTHSDPVGQVIRLRSDLIASGASHTAAIDSIFSRDPDLHAQFAAVVRSNPGALSLAAQAEAERRIVAKMGEGMTRQRAAAAVFSSNPELQQALRGQPAPAQQSSAGRPACVAEVERRVEALKATGLSHARSVSQVFALDPTLHAEYRRAHQHNHRGT